MGPFLDSGPIERGLEIGLEAEPPAMNFVKAVCTRIFSRPSGFLGHLGGLIMAHSNRRMDRRAIRLLDVRPNEEVLEIGFGPGVGIQLVANSTLARWVAGVDPSDEMCDQARVRNAAAIEADRVALRRESVGRLSFADATFDKALAVRSLELWPDLDAGLRELRRVLRPGGKLVVGVTHRSGQTDRKLTELLTAAGFAGTRVVHGHGTLFGLASKPREGGA